MIEKIKWLGHGSFIIEDSPLIYINPWRVTVNDDRTADIILVGHEHYEHCSPADINKIKNNETLIISNEKVAEQINNCTILRPWHSLTQNKTSIKAIPAYSPDNLQHPKNAGGLGFIISINYYDIYYAGDTGIIPEMDRIRPDIAILPIDNNGTLSIDEAVEVVKKMRPRWVFPSNWGTTHSKITKREVEEFKEAVGERAEVIIPE